MLRMGLRETLRHGGIYEKGHPLPSENEYASANEQMGIVVLKVMGRFEGCAVDVANATIQQNPECYLVNQYLT